jgi:hypothetical protein
MGQTFGRSLFLKTQVRIGGGNIYMNPIVLRGVEAKSLNGRGVNE